jgi:hypothetical protein
MNERVVCALKANGVDETSNPGKVPGWETEKNGACTNLSDEKFDRPEPGPKILLLGNEPQKL